MSLVYRALVGMGDKVVPARLRPLWQHPAGPKTVFFWAPAFKWVCLPDMSSICVFVYEPVSLFVHPPSHQVPN